MRRILLPALSWCIGLPIMSALADPPAVQVDQIDRNFDKKAVTIETGQTIRFTNEDQFLHQIYVEAPDFSFDSDEQAPGDHLDVKFPVKGEFEVRCGIHPRMRLDVTVK